MKKLLLLLPLSFFYFLNAAAQKAKIIVHLNYKVPIEKLYLGTADTNDENITDSAKIKNGQFVFYEKVTTPKLINLWIVFDLKKGEKYPRVDGTSFFMEPGVINITAQDSFHFVKVSGSKSQKDFELINKMKEPFYQKRVLLGNEYTKYEEAKDSLNMRRIGDEIGQVESATKEEVYLKFLKEHPKSMVGLYALRRYAGSEISAKKVEPLFDELKPELKNSKNGKRLKEEIEIAKKTGIGVYAMGFTQNDTLGKPVSLSSFKGKYVLLDFWASWCTPCRAENPNLVKAFNQYKDKNFTVISVSLDRPGKQQAWLNAIHKDGLWWTNLSDLKYFDNAVAKLYGISAIPQNLLIDPQGKIIAKNLKGEKLNKKLEEVLK